MSNTAEITLDGKTFSFPVITGTEGEKAAADYLTKRFKELVSIFT